MSSGWGVPMISYGCTRSTLSLKDMYSTFARSKVSHSSIGPIVGAIMQLFQWERIIIVSETNSEWDSTVGQIEVIVVSDLINK